MALSAVIAGRVIQSQRAAREGRQRRISAAADNCQSTEALFNDLLQRAEGAELSKAQMSAGQLTTLHSGSAPMRSALDLGDELAVRTLADLDPLTLTSTCCSDGTPLMYLRTNPGHPHIKKLLPLLENLLLKEGFVPFSDGSAIPVDLLLAAISERREDLLKERVRSGIIDYRQFKTLKALLSLPEGFEQTDASLSSLIRAATRRTGPRPYGYRPEEEDFDEADDDDDDDDKRWCSVS